MTISSEPLLAVYLTAPKIWADCEWVELLMAGAALALHSGSSAEAESPVARAVPE